MLQRRGFARLPAAAAAVAALLTMRLALKFR